MKKYFSYDYTQYFCMYLKALRTINIVLPTLVSCQTPMRRLFNRITHTHRQSTYPSSVVAHYHVPSFAVHFSRTVLGRDEKFPSKYRSGPHSSGGNRKLSIYNCLFGRCPRMMNYINWTIA